MLDIPPPRATRDHLPEEAAARRRLLDRFARVAEAYGYQPIETPSFEKVELFSARSGPEIRGSMLTFHCDHEEFALRPELTAPVCRVAASGALDDRPKPHRLYYAGSCFRYTRPGSGRDREFTQAGLELLGAAGPEADAEVIAAACRFPREIGIKEFSLKVGTVGIFRDLLPKSMDPEDRSTVMGHLDRLVGIRELCAEAGSRASALEELKIDRKELAAIQERGGYEGEYAIADQVDVSAKELMARLPAEAEATLRDLWLKEGLVSEEIAAKLIAVSRIRGSLDHVVAEARPLLEGTSASGALDELVAVCRALEPYALGEFEVVVGIARGFTFYTGTVFEISEPGGKKYGGGGRYDFLVELFGGPPTPAAGCAFRFDALMEAFRSGADWTPEPAFEVYFRVAPGAARARAVQAAERLRGQGRRVGVGDEPAPPAARIIDASEGDPLELTEDL